MRKVMDAGAALMSERERQVMMASVPRNLMELSRRELERMVKRARGIMDRYAQRSVPVERVVPGRRIPLRSRKVEGTTMHTRRKAAMFRTALARFELRLGRMAKAALPKARPAMRKPRVGKSTRALPSRTKTGKATRRARVTTARTKTGKATRLVRVTTPRTKATRVTRATPTRTTAMARATPPRTKTPKATRRAGAMPMRPKTAMTPRRTARAMPPLKTLATPTVRPVGYTRRTQAKGGVRKVQRVPVMNPREL